MKANALLASPGGKPPTELQTKLAAKMAEAGTAEVAVWRAIQRALRAVGWQI